MALNESSKKAIPWPTCTFGLYRRSFIFTSFLDHLCVIGLHFLW